MRDWFDIRGHILVVQNFSSKSGVLKESRRKFNLLAMQKVVHTIRSLSRARQIVLAGSSLALLATFAPWHTVGTVVLGTEHSFSGFADQNMIIGVIVFVFLASALAIAVLPAFGFRLPRTCLLYTSPSPRD